MKVLLRKIPMVWLALAVFFTALVPRGIYFSHLKEIPYFDGTAFLQVEGMDQREFIEQAQEILKEGPIGTKPFHKAPLYSYYMALVFKLTGSSIPVMRLVQLVMGALGCVLVLWIASAVFGPVVGTAAGLAAALCPIAVFYDATLLRASFAAQLNLVFLAALLAALRSRAVPWWVLGGVFFGLSILVRPNAALFFPVLCVWILLAFRPEGPRAFLKPLAGVVLGMLLVAGMLVGRNLAAGVPAVSLSSVGPYNFYLGNAADAVGIGFSVPDSYKTAPGDQLVKAALESALEDPAAFLSLYARKAYGLINGFEHPNNMNFYLFQEFSWVLRNPLLSFAVLSPLGIMGLVLSFRRSRESMLLGLFCAIWFVSVLFFFVTSRFRYPVVPLSIVFSAYTAAWFLEKIRHRGFLRCAPALIALGGLFFVTAPRLFPTGWVRDKDVVNLGIAYKSQGKFEQAAASFQRAMTMNPEHWQARQLYHFYQGVTLSEKGNWGAAAQAFQEALALDPDSTPAQQNFYYCLGNHYFGQGQCEAAAAAYRRVLQITPGLSVLRKKLAQCEEKLGG